MGERINGYLKGDFLVTADASKPAPFFAELLDRLANPDPYAGNTDPEYRRAIDAINAAFGKRVEADLRFTMDMEKQRRRA